MTPAIPEAAAARDDRVRLGAFSAVFMPNALIAAAALAGVLGRSLLMSQLGFAAGAIRGTAAVSATVAVPIPSLGGSLSDRIGRVPVLVGCALLGGVGLLILSAAVSIWQVWIAMSLLAIMMSTTGAVGPALIADLIPAVDRDRALAWVNASSWLGAVVGFAAFGTTAMSLGVPAELVAGVVLPLLAVALLVLLVVRTPRGRPALQPGAQHP